LIQGILEPLANAEARVQLAFLVFLEGCLIGNRVMTDTFAMNCVRYQYQYLAFIDERAIPADLDSWIRGLRSPNVSIDSLRSGLDRMQRQVIHDNATIDGVLSGLTGSTDDHKNGQGVIQAHQAGLLLQLLLMPSKLLSYLLVLMMLVAGGIMAPDAPAAADGIQALEAPHAPAAADGIQAPYQQDAGHLQVQRSPALSNLRELGHGQEGDESIPSEGGYGSSTVGYHMSRGSGGTNPNVDA
jgi:hypothetical protein